MPKARELLRVGLPFRLKELRAILDMLDGSQDNTIVRHYNGSLIIEEPHPMIVDTPDPTA